MSKLVRVSANPGFLGIWGGRSQSCQPELLVRENRPTRNASRRTESNAPSCEKLKIRHFPWISTGIRENQGGTRSQEISHSASTVGNFSGDFLRIFLDIFPGKPPEIPQKISQRGCQEILQEISRKLPRNFSRNFPRKIPRKFFTVLALSEIRIPGGPESCRNPGFLGIQYF